MINPKIKHMLSQSLETKMTETTKIREVLQQTALLGLQRHGFFEKAAFYGGTALRILYGLDRFSEDLDFTLLKPDKGFNFNPFLEGMQRELASFGFDMEVNLKNKTFESSVLSAFMKMNTITLHLAIGSEKTLKTINHNEKVHIKLEVDVDPPTVFRVENHLVLNPLSFYVLTLHKGDLFAGKMYAALYRAWKNRVKGRDWYDLIWYIQNQVPLNIDCLEKYMRQGETRPSSQKLTKELLLELLRAKLEKIDWEGAKNDVRPFIAEPDKLKIWSASYFSDLLSHLKIESP
jgi:predicted nucleotidyltransferase component of viral defense system